METHHIKIVESGIKILNGRDYHEPSSYSAQFAHDIIEHTLIPHLDPIIDELMALGSLIAGREKSSEYLRKNDSVSLEIAGIFEYCFKNKRFIEGDNPADPSFNGYIERAKTFFRNTIRSKIEVYEFMPKCHPRYKNIKKESEEWLDQLDERAVLGWISKGYDLYHERFHNTELSVDLFTRVENLYGELRKLFLPIGYECDLIVDPQNYECFIDHKKV